MKSRESVKLVETSLVSLVSVLKDLHCQQSCSGQGHRVAHQCECLGNLSLLFVGTYVLITELVPVLNCVCVCVKL